MMIHNLFPLGSMFPRSTHETFAQKLYQTFKNHKRFTKPKLARSDFTICHYAGDVSYRQYKLVVVISCLAEVSLYMSAGYLSDWTVSG